MINVLFNILLYQFSIIPNNYSRSHIVNFHHVA
ncbi:MAG: hypothetical protein ACI906_003782, partial [Candidatus Latescibacterota bacterium]